MSTDITIYMASGAWQTPYESKVDSMLYRNNLKCKKGLMISIIIEKHNGLAVFMYGILCGKEPV